MPSPKLTPVGRLLRREHHGAAVELPVAPDELADPTFVPRLSFRATPRLSTDFAALTAGLKEHRGHALFIDTNMLDVGEEWWGELLSEAGRAYVTARVLRESMPYLRRRPDHPLRLAILADSPSVVLVPDPSQTAESSFAFDYYLALLLSRRLLLSSHVARFEAQHGRQPTSAERSSLHMRLQAWAGSRTLRLNLKPVHELLTDEALVVQGVMHAIRTGQPTKIISGDLDVEEQFYVMLRLITMHYYAMLLGRCYAREFASFRPQTVDVTPVHKHTKLFGSQSAVLIDLGERGIHDFIPIHTTFVPVSCLTIGQQYTSEITYGAETAMHDVLDVKERTGGLSTDLLGGRDVRPWFIPEEISALTPGNSALISHEATVPGPTGQTRLSNFDLMATIWPGDPHVGVSPRDPGATRPRR